MIGQKQLRGPDGKPIKIYQDFVAAMKDTSEILEAQHTEATERIKKSFDQNAKKVTSPIGVHY